MVGSNGRSRSIPAGDADAWEARGCRVTQIGAGRDIGAGLGSDVAFSAPRGRFGEDGTIQGLLEILGIPCTPSGVPASALAMQKDLAKSVMQSAGAPVASGRVVDRFEAACRHALEPPDVLKPLNEGASFGVVIVKADRAHPPQEAGRADWLYGDRLLSEPFVAGKALTCAVMGARALNIVEIDRCPKPSTATTQNTSQAARRTFYLRSLNQKFTMKFKTWRSRRIALSAAAV